MKRYAIAPGLAMVTACASGGPPVVSTVPGAAAPSAVVQSDAPAYPARCSSTLGPPPRAAAAPTPLKHLSIRVRGQGLERFEGKRVWLSAVERDRGTADDPGIVVLLEGRVSRGAFELQCPGGLTSNVAYPTWSVTIDADDSGRCTSQDVQYLSQMYGWDDDMVADLRADSFAPVQQAHTVVGDRKSFDYCSLYFPSARR
ncbi:MAG: hypothetical protein JST00_34880 [Deltaproteobacteria bacterium]|nr:hypothetical protein [Deltaproteobacteria bacterium]